MKPLIYITPEGSANVIMDCPEKHYYGYYNMRTQSNDFDSDGYEQALAEAKKNSIPFESQKEVTNKLFPNSAPFTDSIHPFPSDQYKVEIKGCDKPCDTCIERVGHCAQDVAVLSPLKPQTEILMRTDCDCMVACLAMLMGWSYEQAADFFPPKAITETGYRWEMLVPYLSTNRIRLVWYGSDALTSVDWSRPAMVDVPSLTAPEKGDHIIFWDGRRVIDPTRKLIKYTELPSEILNVYQLKP